MNRREIAAISALTVAFLLGAALTLARRSTTAAQAARAPIAVVADSAAFGGTPGPAQPGQTLDLNTASRRELEALPGIGPVIADRIVAYRDRAGGFGSVEELRKVGGIGPKRYASLCPLVRVGPAAETAR